MTTQIEPQAQATNRVPPNFERATAWGPIVFAVLVGLLAVLLAVVLVLMGRISALRSDVSALSQQVATAAATSGTASTTDPSVADVCRYLGIWAERSKIPLAMIFHGTVTTTCEEQAIAAFDDARHSR